MTLEAAIGIGFGGLALGGALGFAWAWWWRGQQVAALEAQTARAVTESARDDDEVVRLRALVAWHETVLRERLQREATPDDVADGLGRLFRPPGTG